MKQTVIGLFNRPADAQKAIDHLTNHGFSDSNIDFLDSSRNKAGVSDNNDTDTAVAGDNRNRNFDLDNNNDRNDDDNRITRFFKNLFGDDDNDTTRRYSNAVARGKSIVTVYTDSEKDAHKAADILDDNGAINADNNDDDNNDFNDNDRDVNVTNRNDRNVDRHENDKRDTNIDKDRFNKYEDVADAYAANNAESAEARRIDERAVPENMYADRDDDNNDNKRTLGNRLRNDADNAAADTKHKADEMTDGNNRVNENADRNTRVENALDGDVQNNRDYNRNDHDMMNGNNRDAANDRAMANNNNMENRDNRRMDANADKTSVPIIEENVQIGKRVVEGGGVRLRSRIVERPVEENLRLREERVVMNRNKVDRVATEADLQTFKEGTIEMVERSEVPVVTKEARVVEEISLGKEVNERNETVRDTARKTEVDVEQLKGEDRNAARNDDDVRRGN